MFFSNHDFVSPQAQKSCRHLDETKSATLEGEEAKSFLNPPEKWFWPKLPKKEKDEEDEEVDAPERLKDSMKRTAGDEEKEEEADEEEEEDMFSASEKLGMLVMYLRTTHLFCLYCGIAFTSVQEMLECPGITREDHDD